MNVFNKFIAKFFLVFFVFSSAQGPIFAAGEQNNVDAKVLKYQLLVAGLILASGCGIFVACDHTDFVTDPAIAFACRVGGILTFAASIFGVGLTMGSAHEEGERIRAEAEAREEAEGNAGR